MDACAIDDTMAMALPIASTVLLSAKVFSFLGASSRVLSLVGSCSGSCGGQSVSSSLTREAWSLKAAVIVLWWLWVALQVQLLVFLVVTKTVVGGFGDTFLSRELEVLQLALFRKLPSRVISRVWGQMVRIRLPEGFLRLAALRTYVWLFGCKVEEAVEDDLRAYPSLLKFFTRTLKDGVRQISPDHPLVSPADGTILHFGMVENRQVEQVKGVTYQLSDLLGPEAFEEDNRCRDPPSKDAGLRTRDIPAIAPSKGNEIFHAIIYLGPGDYHHFHSPTDWNVQMRRHIVGELLTVAPWAARLCPGLFTLNERVVLSGYWEHGYFSMTTVGAFNVGSIELSVDEELKTNLETEETDGQVRSGQFADKFLGEVSEGIPVRKGHHMGHFNLGSSIVLLFEAPKDFRFVVAPGNKVEYGQALGRVAGQAHRESDLE